MYFGLFNSDLTDEFELYSRLFDITVLEILFQSNMANDELHIELDELKLYEEMLCQLNSERRHIY
jgi:hypothetical protein